MGTTNHREAIEFFFGNVVTGDNYFRDGVLFKNFIYGIDCSKDRITIHLFALISKIIIDKTNRAQPQAKVIKKFLQGINTPPSLSQKIKFYLSHFLKKARIIWRPFDSVSG